MGFSSTGNLQWTIEVRVLLEWVSFSSRNDRQEKEINSDMIRLQVLMRRTGRNLEPFNSEQYNSVHWMCREIRRVVCPSLVVSSSDRGLKCEVRLSDRHPSISASIS
ncbi:hypothetical protein NPIL_526361 [Nephila pilipes]|uniref:Uncharacterized protein n=1 Tax=Nephila pilipes TaxID=299642 RepID=A0A8X6UB12_NEPPI|nr:hypothetical protein NPIL_526361 [Nephila pilipes]